MNYISLQGKDHKVAATQVIEKSQLIFYVYRKTRKGLKFYGAFNTEAEANHYVATCNECYPKSVWMITNSLY